MPEREQLLDKLEQLWDIIVIGGGITGAGVLREAAGQGLCCLLLEQKDFAWGTSSRSGKLVHGGLRYLKQGQVRTTWHSVRERERLLRQYHGLVEPMGFLFPTYRDRPLDPLLMRIGINIYDLMALKRNRCRYKPGELAFLAPGLKIEGMTGGLYYQDACTDDARLVLRVIKEGIKLGGTALNYARVEDLLKDSLGYVKGVVVKDHLTGKFYEVLGQVIISAAGVWSDKIRAWAGSSSMLRPLRGSHLIFPRWRFPLAQAVSFMHPEDRRPIYIIPWEGVTLVGTTDVDHESSLDQEPYINSFEGEYLLYGAQKMFPCLGLKISDVISTFSGVRPVINTGKKDPSKESRDFVIKAEKGMVTVTGGKLTTFGLLAREAIKQAARFVKKTPLRPGYKGDPPVRMKSSELAGQVGIKQVQRLLGRYGPEAVQLIQQAEREELALIPGTGSIWAELSWSAEHEGVVHLEDLMLRRVRLGNLTNGGGIKMLDKVRQIVQPALGWNDDKWSKEVQNYTKLWGQAYSPNLINS